MEIGVFVEAKTFTQKKKKKKDRHNSALRCSIWQPISHWSHIRLQICHISSLAGVLQWEGAENRGYKSIESPLC